jgi:hypothetical protein
MEDGKPKITTIINVVENYINNQSTVNVCTLDLSKAFDRVNHYALFIKLMDRRLPNEILCILETWFCISKTCIKWDGHVSKFFKLITGVRQGGVLSPILFAVFIDDIVYRTAESNIGCFLSSMFINVILYADDIVLIAPTVTGLQRLVNVCELEFVKLDMRINLSKSMCLRFGPRFNIECAELSSIHGGTFKWVDKCRYLGVYFVSGRTFQCSFDQAKCKFYRAFNAIYSKVGCSGSEDIVLTLLKSKCVPVLLYATEACPLLSHQKKSMDFALTRLLMKIFKTGSSKVVAECQRYFHFLPPSLQITIRSAKFLQCFTASGNKVCSLFSSIAKSQLDNIYSAFGSTIHTPCKLSNAIHERFCACV